MRHVPALSLLAASLLAASTAHAGALTIATSDWVGYGPLFLARDLGYFKEAGVDVTLQVASGGTDIEMSMMLAHQVDAISATVDYVVKYGGPGVCFKIVDALDDSYGGDGLLVPADITDIRQLKGKSIALSESSTSEYWLDYLLQNAGMAPTDVSVLNMGPDDAAAAFIAGRVPYAMTWEPHLSFVRQSGQGKVLIDSKSSPGVIVDVIAVRCDTIEKQRADVQAMVSAVLKADDYIAAHQAEAYAIMKKYVGGFLPDDAAFGVAMKGVRYYDRAKNQEYVGTAENPGKLAEMISFAGQVWSRNPSWADGVKGNTYAKIVDPSFIAK